MALPEHLSTAHLRAGVLPSVDVEDAAAHRTELAAALDTALLRLDLRGDLLDGWRLRLPVLPLPPRRQTLQEVVQTARVRLREDRVAADRTELVNRRFVVEHLREGLR
ncbi:hypothetical protein [uncultured Cellulomonas sp.]|uniref:hypothetical protein n=1 Tax=uncultured Cellulomonas sp. TaxID=189682 RepID=UPI00260EF20C|nr:hypothetical protein [uncultured Cellulomonas sp.]